MNLHQLLAPEVEWTKSDWFIQYFTQVPVKKTSIDLSYLKEINSKYYLNFHRALVEEIDASNSKINADGMAILSCFKQLKCIKLVQCQSIDDHSMENLATLDHLQTLDLSKTTKISAVGLAYLKNLTSLRVLNLSNTKVNNTAIESLKNLSIEELNLSRTNVTEEIITQLYSSNIRHSLTRLLLSGNKIGAKLDALTLLKEFPHLTHINLVGTSVNSSAMTKLRDEFKKIEGVTGVKMQGNILDITRVLQLSKQTSSVKQLIESKDMLKFIEINQSVVDKKSRVNNANTFTSQWTNDKENMVNGTETRVSPVKQPLESVMFVEFKKTSPVKSNTGAVVSYGPSTVVPLSPAAQSPVTAPLSSPVGSRYDNLVEVKRALFTDTTAVSDPLFDEEMRLDVVPVPVTHAPPVSVTSPVRREARDRPLTPIKSSPRTSPHAKSRPNVARTPPRLQSTPQHVPLMSPNQSQDLYFTPSESFSPSMLSASSSLYYSFTTQSDDNDLILIESSTDASMPSPRRSVKKKRTPVRRMLSSPGTKRSLSHMLEEQADTPYAQNKKRRPLAPLTAAQVNVPLMRPEPVCHVTAPPTNHMSASTEHSSIGGLVRKGPVLRPRTNNVHWIDKVLHMVHYK
eukprot:TRINITY_DN9282_c0_g1_i1.p1 TRINITY_DN9282_c0_g1~~TRINITY_DN9282_c0_g1_i1.p1  ORF type:complete len:627 (+),score=184.98 TRINITY_DN9282_c0_g1_i1:27-1907(+)